MNPSRRSFLALIASAPIAALAPWPKVLESPVTAYVYGWQGRNYLSLDFGDAFAYQREYNRLNSRLNSELIDQWTDEDRAARRDLGLAVGDWDVTVEVGPHDT